MANKNVQVDKDFQDLFLKSKLGPTVLGKMIDEFGFLDVTDDPETVASHNVIKTILSWTGIGLGLTGIKYIQALAGKKLENLEEEEENE